MIDVVNSSWCSIPSSVPQGSLLGPLIFVIFISDLPDFVTPGNNVSFYADDCKTSRVLNCPSDHSLFQTDIDNIYRWSIQNHMEFNVKKGKLIQICKKRYPLLSDLHLNRSTLELTSEFVDLGLITNCNLSWKNHIDKKTSRKANKILGHKGTFFFPEDTLFLITLLTILILTPTVQHNLFTYATYNSCNYLQITITLLAIT